MKTQFEIFSSTADFIGGMLEFCVIAVVIGLLYVLLSAVFFQGGNPNE